MSSPLASPVPAVIIAATKPTTLATLMLCRAILTLRLRSKYQLLTAMTKPAPNNQALETVCANLWTAKGWKATAKKSIISLRTVSGLKFMPVGCCIQLLATKIHHAESVAPKPVSQVEARWKPLLILPQPKNINAMKVDSMKKAKMPSMASGAPKMSPTNQE